MRERVDLRLTVLAPTGGRWFAYGDGSAEQAAQESRYFPPGDAEAAGDPWDLLASRAQHLHERWVELQAEVRAHVSAESFDTTDLASRWDDEAARQRVLAGLGALERELSEALGARVGRAHLARARRHRGPDLRRVHLHVAAVGQ